GGHEIKLVAQMRYLRAVGGSCGEPDLQVGVDENLSRTSRRPRKGERGGKRYRRRRAFHCGDLQRRRERPADPSTGKLPTQPLRGGRVNGGNLYSFRGRKRVRARHGCLEPPYRRSFP